MPDPASPGQQPTDARDPYTGYRFIVEVAGVVHAYFQECSGMSMTTEVKDFWEGGLNDNKHKLPGRTNFSNVTLKRGLTDSTDMWDWIHDFNAAQDKTSQTKDVAIVQLDFQGGQLYRWELGGAWPVKWTGPSFNTSQSSMSVETFEVAFASLTAVKVA